MKKFLAITVMMSLLTVSCGKSGGGSSSGTGSTQAVTDSPSSATTGGSGSGSNTDTSTPPATSTLPAQALSFSTNITLDSFTTAQAAKYNAAIAIVKKVVATETFRTQVLNYTYNGSKTYANSKGLTNAQIYQSILDAAETLKPVKNNTMDLGVKLYYAATTVIGYTNASITYINVNTKYFDQFAANEVAGNLFHEWLHKIGYDHDSAATTARPHSVPYAIGYMVRDIGKQFL